MKKVLENRFFVVFITALICIGGTVGAAMYYSNQVQYSNGKSSVTNVKGALDELYEKQASNVDELVISGTPTWKKIAETNGVSSNFVILYSSKLYLFNKPVDLTKYKYLVLIYHKYEYYTSTLGMGVINKANATLSECQNISTKQTISWTGNSVDKKTAQIIYLDVSDLKGEYYPFLYYTSNMYSGYLYYYLTNDENIPSL